MWKIGVTLCSFLISNIIWAQTATTTTAVTTAPAAVSTPAAAPAPTAVQTLAPPIAPAPSETVATTTTTTTTPSTPTTTEALPAPVTEIPAITPVTYYKTAGIPAVANPEEEVVTKVTCPPISNYSVPSGYRIAGISPSCLGVPVPMFEPWP